MLGTNSLLFSCKKMLLLKRLIHKDFNLSFYVKSKKRTVIFDRKCIMTLLKKTVYASFS